MASDITKEDLREALQAYYNIPTEHRARQVIQRVPDLVDELDVKDERLRELDVLASELQDHVDSLEHELRLSNAKLVELQRGRTREPEVTSDYQGLLEAHGAALEHDDEATGACLRAIPELLAENTRLRHDSKILQSMLDAAAHFVGLLNLSKER